MKVSWERRNKLTNNRGADEGRVNEDDSDRAQQTCLRRWVEAGTALSKRPAPDDVAEQVPAEDRHGCGPGECSRN